MVLVKRTGAATYVLRNPIASGWVGHLPAHLVLGEDGQPFVGWALYGPEVVTEPLQPEPAEGAEVPQGEPEDLSTLTAAQLREHLADLGIEVPSSARTKAALLALFPGG